MRSKHSHSHHHLRTSIGPVTIQMTQCKQAARSRRSWKLTRMRFADPLLFNYPFKPPPRYPVPSSGPHQLLDLLQHRDPDIVQLSSSISPRFSPDPACCSLKSNPTPSSPILPSAIPRKSKPEQSHKKPNKTHPLSAPSSDLACKVRRL